MGRPTNPGRLTLAVLTAATAPSLVFGLLTIGAPPKTRLDHDGHVVMLDGFDRAIHAVTSVFSPLAFGGPLCLGLVLLFAPLWAAHHQRQGGLVSFLFAAALVAALPAGVVAWVAVAVMSSLAKHTLDGGPVLIAIAAAGGGLFGCVLGLILWFIAYGGRRSCFT